MKSTMQATLDANDVSNILITAFDGGYGGANYWADNLDDDGTLFIVRPEVSPESSTEWLSVTLTPTGTDRNSYQTVYIGPDEVTKAFNAILSGSFPIRSDLREQCVRSAAEGDLDIDADVADCIAQFVVFGELVYG